MGSNCTGHPTFRASNAFERGKLRSIRGGKKSIHFNGSHENIECLLRPVISANQLSVYGAISIKENSANAQQRGNLMQEYERTFEQLSDDQKLSKLCSDAGLKLVETGQYFHTLDTERLHMQHLCREYSMPRNEKRLVEEVGFSRIRRSAQS